LHNASTQTFEKASQELDAICAWFQEIGIKFSVTRVGKYRAIFAALSAAQRLKDMSVFYKRYKELDYFNAIMEREQLLRIYTGLEGIKEKELIDRLKKCVRSHELSLLDTENRSGRDFSLELDVAAKFVKAGYQVDFAHDADVSASKDGQTVFVECKRLKSSEQVKDNIKKGLKQLVNRYKSSKNPTECRGLLVLSIGKIVNQKFGYMEGDNIEDVGNNCALHIQDFMNKYARYWAGADHRSLSVMLVLDTPGVARDRHIVYSVHEVVFTNIIPESSPEFPRLHKLVSSLASGPIWKDAD
jgi:hypothetical protein